MKRCTFGFEGVSDMDSDISKGGEMSVDPKSTYYDAGGIETIEIIKAKSLPNQFMGYLICNIIKYACRLNFKGQMLRDIEKIITYATMLKDELEK